MFKQFRQASQHVADTGWSNDPREIEDTKNTLHDQTYTAVREQTSLQASLVQSTRNLTADAFGNWKDRILNDGKNKLDEYERRRGCLQQTGTRSAHLTIESTGSRFEWWNADYLHRVSKTIVQEVVRNDCLAIAFENLTRIRERISNASKFQQ